MREGNGIYIRFYEDDSNMHSDMHWFLGWKLYCDTTSYFISQSLSIEKIKKMTNSNIMMIMMRYFVRAWFHQSYYNHNMVKKNENLIIPNRVPTTKADTPCINVIYDSCAPLTFCCVHCLLQSCCTISHACCCSDFVKKSLSLSLSFLKTYTLKDKEKYEKKS